VCKYLCGYIADMENLIELSNRRIQPKTYAHAGTIEIADFINKACMDEIIE